MPREDEKRQYYRLTYPLAERPRLALRGHFFLVIDLSEGGAMIARGRSGNPVVGEEVQGTLTFPDGEQEQVAGTVLRSNEISFAITFQKGVSMRRMMMEQRRVFTRYLRPD